MLTKTLTAAAALLLATSAHAFDFVSPTSGRWTVEIPNSWYVIDTPEGLAEGIHLRLSSDPAATWQRPMPSKDQALIVIDFTPVSDEAGQQLEIHPTAKDMQVHQAIRYTINVAGTTLPVTLYDNGLPSAKATLDQIVAGLHKGN